MKVMQRASVLLVGGGLLLLASFAHAFGWSQFDAGLVSVTAETRSALHIGWLWGSATFAALGLTVILAALGARRGCDPRPAVAPTATALLLFGVGGLVARGGNPHFLGFITLGLVLGLPLLGAAWRHAGPASSGRTPTRT